MKCLITGHRLFKLENYSVSWIKNAISDVVLDNNSIITYGYSGMASGVDLWFCSTCSLLSIPYCACIPFDGQDETMNDEEKSFRQVCLDKASTVVLMKNSLMVEKSDMGIVVWDGNKGGTHNVAQQLIEKNKPFFWINPVGKKVWKCF